MKTGIPLGVRKKFVEGGSGVTKTKGQQIKEPLLSAQDRLTLFSSLFAQESFLSTV